MADLPPASHSAADVPIRSWFPLTGAVAAWAAFNLVLDPANREYTSEPGVVHVMLSGAAMTQPFLLSLWAAFGPPPAMARVLLSIVALAMVVLIRPVWEWMMGLGQPQFRQLEVQTAISMTMSFFAGLALGGALRWWTGWQLDQMSEAPAPVASRRQYSLRYLLIIMTLVAVVLAVVRTIGWAGRLDFSGLWDAIRQGWLLECGLFVLLLFPIAVIALISFSRGLRVLAASLAVVVLMASSAAAFAIISTIFGPGFGSMFPEVAVRVLQAQFGAMLFCLANVVALRFAGYRLQRRPKLARSTDAGDALH